MYVPSRYLCDNINTSTKRMSKSANTAQMPVVLAVASFGGHLVQLMRMMRSLECECRPVYVSTAEEGRPEGCEHYYVVQDFSRSDLWRAFDRLANLRKIIKKERPDIVISTGAAPGLMAIIVARLMGIRTVWIDSIANADRLSMCGRVARHIAHRTLTQWPHLAVNGVEYHGNILSD